MRTFVRLFAVLLVVSLGACQSTPTRPEAVRIPDLGHYHRPIETKSADAQSWFDQGLTLHYAFNHEEAIRSFRRAATIDPDCAMALWGMALAAGPNINNPEMDEAASKAAYSVVQKAVHLVQGRKPSVERDLVLALAKRYDWPPPADRSGLDQAFAEAMREVWTKYPNDPDVGTIYGESLMDLRPWDLWTAEGDPRPGTEEVVSVFETVIRICPDHPGANHYYVHTMEASSHPEKAIASANRLRDLVPGAGHLVHMPAHIDIRLGHYDDAVRANQKAIDADLRYVALVGRGGFYNLYRAHNYHFLAYAAMFDGRLEVAMKAARDMVAEIPPALVRQYPDFLDAFLSVPIHVMVRFGLWEELLLEPKPAADLPASVAFWHYGRTVAFSALGRVDEATAEFDAFRKAKAAVPASRLFGNNPASVLLDIADPMAEGELEYRRGNYDRAYALLREAVARDDALRYDEPWGWMQPIRHALGALLLEQGHVEEAEAVYREDLRRHPANGWSLNGLAECLTREGRTEEAKAMDAEFRAAWARSDIELRVSCFCRTQS